MNDKFDFLTLQDRRLAYQQLKADASRWPQTAPGIVFFGGYASDMTGTKASFLAEKCAEAGIGYVRFDYRGHGQSSGTFTDCTIGDWFADSLAVFDQLTEGPQILVGSSMGGWMALLVARERPDRVAQLIGMAPAPDFTDELILPTLTPAQREQLTRDGLVYDESDPEGRLPITLKLIEESRAHFVLQSPLALPCPVHILQGQQDKSVPWKFALKIAEHIESPDVRVTLFKDADHRLSRPAELAFLWEAVKAADIREHPNN